MYEGGKRPIKAENTNQCKALRNLQSIEQGLTDKITSIRARSNKARRLSTLSETFYYIRY